MDRFKEIDQAGLMCDLLWSDPVNANSTMWEKNKIRSCSYVFSKKQAEKFIADNKIEMIIRGH
jgi:diadenosine tetraphosphatase ApaH/serine/threonine PP2A family protein phosphatase